MLRALSFLLVLLWLLPLFFATPNANALSPEYQSAFERELRLIIERNPRYVWGGSESEEKGLDCSGYLYLAARRAGIPVTRTTAFNMARGLGGWAGINVSKKDVTHLDLAFWTWHNKPTRPDGHTGVTILNPGDPQIMVTHASVKRGIILEPMKGPFLRDLTTIRRLTLGD